MLQQCQSEPAPSRITSYNVCYTKLLRLYYKLDAVLADAMMGINAVKAVEIGDGLQT